MLWCASSVRSRTPRCRLGFFLILLGSCPIGGASNPYAQSVDAARVARWQEDLDFLAGKLPKLHKNLFFQMAREEFEDATSHLRESIPGLEDSEIVVELARLVAMPGDGHTALTLFQPGVSFRSLPLEWRRFQDGLFITGSLKEHESSLGTKVLEIDTLDVEEAWKRVSGIVSHDNDAGLKSLVPGYLRLAEVLKALEIAEDMDSIPIRVQGSDGKAFSISLRPLASIPTVGFRRLQATEPPLYLRRNAECYWYECLDDSRTLYLQYNRCENDSNRPFPEFARELWEAADAHEVERLIVDLRHNPGGDSAVIMPLYSGLMREKHLHGPEHLFVLIGPRTASSAMMNALQLKSTLKAKLVGEPTGGKPNSYGELKSFQLPHSKLTVSYSTKYFKLSSLDTRTVNPDLRVELSFEDYRLGRDPVMEAVLGEVESDR